MPTLSRIQRTRATAAACATIHHGGGGSPRRALAAPSQTSTKETTKHWSVTVERNGETVVTIESNCLSGRDLSAEDERTILLVSEHLRAFVGVATPEPQTAIREKVMKLSSVQFGCQTPNYFEAKPLIVRADVLALLDETPPAQVFQRNAGKLEACSYCGEMAVVFYSFNPDALPDMCHAYYKAAKSGEAQTPPQETT